ncbi:MAG TPA: hypothetical protein VGH16_09680 [Candidatus Binatia bacterium]|jgi:hypothetical protein
MFKSLIGAAVSLFSLLAFTLPAQSKFIMPQMTPIDRLVKNAEAYLVKHPNEADAHYTLARFHYLAFSLKRNQAPAIEDQGRLIPAEQWMLDQPYFKPKGNPGAKLQDNELIDHAARGVRSFKEAIRLDPRNALYQLGFASLFEEFWRWSKKTRPAATPPELRDITLRSVRDAYSKTLTRALAKESIAQESPVLGVRKSVTGYEAAAGVVRVGQDGSMTDADKAELKRAKTAMTYFDKLSEKGFFTPIAFSLQPALHLADLLDPDKTVDFDLRGYGPRETWPWVKPELGFLVWDPNESGRIESARQMFGGYTFQIFWRTGYDALRALDDNDDGVLSGSELDGISVWFDRNGDGSSQPDEVVPVHRLGIVSIAVTFNEYDDIHPTNSHGITLKDGRTLRSWDWMVEPHTASRVAAR